MPVSGSANPNERPPNKPGFDFIQVYSSARAAGDDVYRVDKIASIADGFPKTFLVNRSETISSCGSKFSSS